jgi:hypothetical protein
LKINKVVAEGDDDCCSAPPPTTAPPIGDAARPVPAAGTSTAAAVDDDEEAEGSIPAVAGGLVGGTGGVLDMTMRGCFCERFIPFTIAKARRAYTKKMRNETRVLAFNRPLRPLKLMEHYKLMAIGRWLRKNVR